jgi:shikimate kinase
MPRYAGRTDGIQARRLDAPGGFVSKTREKRGPMDSEDAIMVPPELVKRLTERLGNRTVVFVGLMGAGKTAIGRKVAAVLGLPFVDSDHEIERAARMTIPELFEAYGEPEFRALEQRVIQRVLEGGPQILSTGGGAYMNDQTRALIAQGSISVWLKAELDVLFARVSKKQNRPLLKTANPRAALEQLMNLRYPVYAEANITVPTRDEKKEVIVAEVLDALDAYLDAESRSTVQ